jgi:hypothetical protein
MSTNPDAIEILRELNAVWSPDIDGYASGKLPASAIRCLMCETAPCNCQARGLVFGSAAYFDRIDKMHGRTRPVPPSCTLPDCPLTAQVGEHPRGLAISSSGPRDAFGRPGLPTSAACITEPGGGAQP